MKEFITKKSQEAKTNYLQTRTKFDTAIKNAIEESAEIGLNRACIQFQGTWRDVAILSRYLEDLGCTNIQGMSNYSWKSVDFDF